MSLLQIHALQKHYGQRLILLSLRDGDSHRHNRHASSQDARTGTDMVPECDDGDRVQQVADALGEPRVPRHLAATGAHRVVGHQLFVVTRVFTSAAAYLAKAGLKVPVWIGDDRREGGDVLSTDPGRPDRVVAEAAAAIDTPVTKAKTALASTVATPSRPGTHCVSRLTSVNRSRAAPH